MTKAVKHSRYVARKRLKAKLRRKKYENLKHRFPEKLRWKTKTKITSEGKKVLIAGQTYHDLQPKSKKFKPNKDERKKNKVAKETVQTADGKGTGKGAVPHVSAPRVRARQSDRPSDKAQSVPAV